MQHRIWTIIQGGLYPPEAEDIVQELLRPRKDGAQPQVVDIGSGSGIWFVLAMHASTRIHCSS
jgi:methylase of polypeptide subunit release factors